MTKVVLHIDRLVLKGVAPDQRDALVAALRDSLVAALSQSGAAQAWAASGHRAHLRVKLPAANTVAATASASATATALGRACARAIATQGSA